ncbi:MAG: MFS transporter [Chloroflexota bacterium]|nr:MFS transporter [Chloroflexota bacterium]
MTRKQVLILVTLLLGVSMGALDAGIISPALPIINVQLFYPAGLPELTSWAITIYVLGTVVSGPLMAKFSNIYGRKTIYILDILLFTAGSLISGSAELLGGKTHGWWILLAGRLVQSLGNGGITPVAVAEIGRIFPPEKRGLALGLFGSIFGITSVIGPLAGGLLTATVGWNWVFYINLPLAVVVIFMALKKLENSPEEAGLAFDWRGALLLSTLLICFMYGLTQLGEDEAGQRSANIIGSFFTTAVWPYLLVGLLLVGPLLWIEQRVANPIVPVRILNNRQLLVGYLLTVIGGSTMGLLIFLPQAARYILGTDTAASGSLVVPLALTTVFVTPASGILLDKRGSRFVLVLGSAFAALGAGLFSFWVDDLFSFISSTVILGIGFGAIIGSPIRYILINEVSEQDRAPALSASAVFNQTGVLLGTSVIGAIISTSTIILSKNQGQNAFNLPLAIVKPIMQPAIQQSFGIIAISLTCSCLLALFLLKSQASERATSARHLATTLPEKELTGAGSTPAKGPKRL